MEDSILDRSRGCAVGAAIGDALGMPLDSGKSHRPSRSVGDIGRRWYN